MELHGGGSGEHFFILDRVSPRKGDSSAPDSTSRSTYAICVSHGIKSLTDTDSFLLAGLCPQHSSWM